MKKILIANRGEIAVRIIEAAHQLGYQTVAVFSDVDQMALHVKMADQAVFIGGAESIQSYLNIAAIINAAKKVKADAVHPGYGFLAENTDFAVACEEAELTFIGPSPEAINLMGNKAQAKHCMGATNVPCIPGYSGEDQQLATLQSQAQAIGFPLYIKAALGGGGRGMRLVSSMAAFPTAIESAKSEARAAFGNEQLILEKAILKGRHIEFQILADRQGHIVHLGERDCSLQRRHQKVIEEAPSPVVSSQLRKKMGLMAIAAAKAIGYVGAGTVEFLLTEKGDFYFLEMNTRLQVEHPVTEMVTGVDLVQWQLNIADNQPLSIQQSSVIIKGHAIEARLYAEDPKQQFLPQTGGIKYCRFPEAEGVRCDVGISIGQAISPYYDPMLAKIIAVGENREEARRRLMRALQQTVFLGPVTNRQFLTELLDTPNFIEANTHCQFIEQFLTCSIETKKIETDNTGTKSTANIKKLESSFNYKLIALAAISTTINTHQEKGWRSSGLSTWFCRLQTENNNVFTIKLEVSPQLTYRVTVDSQPAIELTIIDAENYQWRYMVEGVIESAYLLADDQDQIFISQQSQQLNLIQLNNSNITLQSQLDNSDVIAPISGCVSTVLINVEQAVNKGDKLAVIEAMKMEHVIVAPISGIIEKINIKKGQQVSSGMLLAEIQETL